MTPKAFAALQKLSHGAMHRVGAAFDEALVNLALDRAGAPPADPQEALETLARVAEAYADPRFFSGPDTFFRPPAPPAVEVLSSRPLPDGGAVEDLRVASAFETVHPGARERYHARPWRPPGSRR